MARLLVVTGVLLAAAAASLGAPCEAASACPCLVEATGDGAGDSSHLDVLPVAAPVARAVDPAGAPAPGHAAPVSPHPAADILAVAPKTSPPAPVA